MAVDEVVEYKGERGSIVSETRPVQIQEDMLKGDSNPERLVVDMVTDPVLRLRPGGP